MQIGLGNATATKRDQQRKTIEKLIFIRKLNFVSTSKMMEDDAKSTPEAVARCQMKLLTF